MKLAERIFRRKDYTVTSKFGKRDVINTSAGNTSTFHNGTDYGTKGEKWPQYALEDGVVLSCGTDSAQYGYAKFVWVKYPRLGIKLLHYHLDEIKVKKGQKVTYKTVLGTTGKTGKATGIHLHLGMKYLDKDEYKDPEGYNYVRKSILPKRGYFKLGDWSDYVEEISNFMYKNFKYTKKSALGPLYGTNLRKAIIQFQKDNKLEADGYLGPITLEKLVEKEFDY